MPTWAVSVTFTIEAETQEQAERAVLDDLTKTSGDWPDDRIGWRLIGTVEEL